MYRDGVANILPSAWPPHPHPLARASPRRRPTTQTEILLPGKVARERQGRLGAGGRPRGPGLGQEKGLHNLITCRLPFKGQALRDRLLTRRCLRFPASSPLSLQEPDFIFISQTISVCELKQLSSHSREGRSFALGSEDANPLLLHLLSLPWALPPTLVQATLPPSSPPSCKSSCFFPGPTGSEGQTRLGRGLQSCSNKCK